MVDCRVKVWVHTLQDPNSCAGLLQVALGGGAAADVTAWPEFHNGVAAGELTLDAH